MEATKKVIKRDKSGMVHIWNHANRDTRCWLFQKGSDRREYKFESDPLVTMKMGKCANCSNRKR